MTRLANIRRPERLGALPLLGRVHLNPNGDHRLEISIEGCSADLLLGRDQVDQLEPLIAEFKRQVAFADGGPDFQHKKVRALG